MRLFKASPKPTSARDHASAAEIVACFHSQQSFLGRLAFLITEDQISADDSVAKACEMTLKGNSPFRDWLLEWAKSATFMSAVLKRAGALRLCGATYKQVRCTHGDHLWQGDAEERAASLDLVLRTDPRKLVAELDPLSRAVLVLRLALRSSIQDCVWRMNVSRSAVLAANCQAMTWLQKLRLESIEANDIASHAFQELPQTIQ
jgi:hypothetical protein